MFGANRDWMGTGCGCADAVSEVRSQMDTFLMSVVVGYFPGGSLSDGSCILLLFVCLFVFGDDDSGIWAGAFYVVYI